MLRPTWSPEITFNQDPSRYVRAIRFAHSKNLSLEPIRSYIEYHAKIDCLNQYIFSREASKIIKNSKIYPAAFQDLVSLQIMPFRLRSAQIDVKTRLKKYRDQILPLILEDSSEMGIGETGGSELKEEELTCLVCITVLIKELGYKPAEIPDRFGRFGGFFLKKGSLRKRIKKDNFGLWHSSPQFKGLAFSWNQLYGEGSYNRDFTQILTEENYEEYLTIEESGLDLGVYKSNNLLLFEEDKKLKLDKTVRDSRNIYIYLKMVYHFLEQKKFKDRGLFADDDPSSKEHPSSSSSSSESFSAHQKMSLPTFGAQAGLPAKSSLLSSDSDEDTSKNRLPVEEQTHERAYLKVSFLFD